MEHLPYWAPALVFLVAALYSSVGHGGASGYLAVLSLFAIPRAEMAATALILNVLVASIALLSFARSHHFRWKLTLPFILLSVPGAFLGGKMDVPERVYSLLLAFALVAAAVRLFGLVGPNRDDPLRPLRPSVAVPLGGAVGVLSGIVGIGGGVFLSPVILLARWATAKQTAATAACFILVNSIAGLASRAMAGNLQVGALHGLVAAAFLGGLLGSSLGSRAFSNLTLRRALAVVLVTAAAKLI